MQKTGTVKLGGGSNSFALQNSSVEKKFSYSGGSDSDFINCRSGGFQDDASFKLADGFNRLAFAFSEVLESLEVSGKNTADEFAIDGSRVRGDVKLQLGSGNNRASVVHSSQIGDELTVTAGDGDDLVVVDPSVKVGRTSFRLGAGANTIP